jgi:hypothetical protein
MALVDVCTHNGVAIKMEKTDGIFYGRPKGRDEDVADKSLDGLKRKLDNIARASVRAQAVALPAVVMVRRDSWEDDSRVKTVDWYEGTFAGINAHTGEISFRTGNNKPLEISSGWFFRADEPALERLRALAADAIATARVAKEADKKFHKEIEAHGHYPRLGYARHKTEEAARAEQALIDFLAPPEAK